MPSSVNLAANEAVTKLNFDEQLEYVHMGGEMNSNRHKISSLLVFT